MAPETFAPEAGEVIETVGGVATVVLTITETAALVAVCPPALLATTASEWLPLESVFVFTEKLKGVVVTAEPEFLPSTWSCTFVVFAETVVETVTVPETFAPDTGEVIETDGGVVTALLTSIETAALVAVWPPALLAIAASVWL